MKRFPAALLISFFYAGMASGEVVDAAPGGFSLAHEVTIAAP